MSREDRLPAPLTAPDTNLQAFRDMPLDVQRFRDSDLITEEDPEVVLAALHLWIAAWHQVPAASLPNDERALSRFAGYGRSLAAWNAVRNGALRGFVLCSDGRLYHRVLSEKANSAWDKRLNFEWVKAKDRHRKAEKNLPEDQRTAFPDFDDWKAGRPAPQTPRKQGRLPLEGEDNSAGTTPPSARAIVPAPARTGSRTVPSDNSNGNADAFQRNDPPIPTENALKGKGIEGNLKEEISIPSPDSENLKRDLVDLHARVCDAAGYRPTSPAAIAASMDQVKEWRDKGYDFDLVILPAIRHVIGTSTANDRTRTLGRFRHAIAREAAKHTTARASGNAPPRPSPVPILDPDGEDPKARPIRDRLLKSLGPDVYCIALNEVRLEPVPVEFGDDRVPLRVRGNERSIRTIRDHYGDTLRKAAKAEGYSDVWYSGDL